jgi:hypothetical protein
MVINFNPKYIPGDIVYNHKKEIIRITSSYLKGTKLFYYIDGNCGWIREDAIKPIPLTPEILEKNGWKLSHGFYWSPNEEGAEVGLSSQTGYVWNAYMKSYPLRSGINSVSDLQHLLFGLGLDSNMIV